MIAQSTWLSTIPSISTDTLLILDKEAARRQANFNIIHIELRHRFAAALTREEQLRKLWENTTERLEVSENRVTNLETQITNLEEQLSIREEQNEAIMKVNKKQKRRSFIKGMLIGITAGSVGTILLLGQ